MATGVRMTGFQAYHRTLKLVIEDAQAELDEHEWQALRDVLRIALGFERPPAPARPALSPTPRR